MYKFVVPLLILCLSISLQAQKKRHITNEKTGSGKSGSLHWKFATGGKVNAAPRLVKNVLYAGSGDNNIYALDARTGKEQWHFTTGGAVHSTPEVKGNTLYALSFDGHLYALDTKTGREKWRFKTEGEHLYGQKGLWGMLPAEQHMADLFQYWLSSPLAVGNDEEGTVYFGSSDHHLYALNAETGTIKWRFRTEGPVHSSPVHGNGIIYIGSWDRNIYAVDAKTGAEVWRFATKRDDSGWGGMQGIQASPVVSNGRVLCGSRDGSFYALNAATGAMEWEYKTGGTWIVGTATVHDGKVYVGTSDTFKLLVLDENTGALLHSFESNGYVYTKPALHGTSAFFGTFTGKIVCADLSTNTIRAEWQTENGKQHSAQVLKDGKIDFAHLFEGLDGKTYEGNIKAIGKLDKLGPIVSSPIVQSNAVFFGSADGGLYCVGF